MNELRFFSVQLQTSDGQSAEELALGQISAAESDEEVQRANAVLNALRLSGLSDATKRVYEAVQE